MTEVKSHNPSNELKYDVHNFTRDTSNSLKERFVTVFPRMKRSMEKSITEVIAILLLKVIWERNNYVSSEVVMRNGMQYYL
jgi:hypothetical protein